MPVKDEAADVWRGRILRAWREASGVSRAELAERLGKTTQAVHNWETGNRSISHWQDGAPPAPAAPGDEPGTGAAVVQTRIADDVAAAILARNHIRPFHSMLAAAGTVLLRPRLLWRKNFLGDAGPVWIWVRPNTDPTIVADTAPSPVAGFFTFDSSAGTGAEEMGHVRIQIAARWGVIGGCETFDVPEAGIFITCPTSVPNPPLEVTLDQPGWVDFGYGALDPDITGRLGATLIDGRTYIGKNFAIAADDAPVRHTMMQWVLARLEPIAATFHIPWTLVLPHARVAIFPESETALDGITLAQLNTAGPLTGPGPSSPGQLTVSSDELAAYRKARGLSRKQVAALVTDLDPQSSVSDGMIERMERGAQPAAHFLITRLDTVYRADGRLGWETVRQAAPARSIDFPEYWIGPIWLQLRGPEPDSEAVVRLHWKLWRRRLRVRSGAIVTTRRGYPDNGPLLIRLPKGWVVAAGTGALPNALDINHNWVPASPFAALTLVMNYTREMQASRTGRTTAPPVADAASAPPAQAESQG